MESFAIITAAIFVASAVSFVLARAMQKDKYVEWHPFDVLLMANGTMGLFFGMIFLTALYYQIFNGT